VPHSSVPHSSVPPSSAPIDPDHTYYCVEEWAWFSNTTCDGDPDQDVGTVCMSQTEWIASGGGDCHDGGMGMWFEFTYVGGPYPWPGPVADRTDLTWQVNVDCYGDYPDCATYQFSFTDYFTGHDLETQMGVCIPYVGGAVITSVIDGPYLMTCPPGGYTVCSGPAYCWDNCSQDYM
jgi:hypothetical protein